MPLTYLPFNQQTLAQLRAGGPDVYGAPAERAISSGVGTPCRSCLCDVPEGDQMLICAARPFESLHPYAETGPVFFCANHCEPHDGYAVPAILKTSPTYLLKAYDADERIIYGTGQITERDQVTDYASSLFEDGRVAYVDVRSARNNCFLTRIMQT